MDLDSQRAVFTIAQPNKQCWAFDFAVFVCWWDPAGVSIGKGKIYVTSQWKDVILQTLHAYECLWEEVCSLSLYLTVSLSLCLFVSMYTPVCSQCVEWSAGAHLCQWRALLFFLMLCLVLSCSLSLARSLARSLSYRVTMPWHSICCCLSSICPLFCFTLMSLYNVLRSREED